MINIVSLTIHYRDDFMCFYSHGDELKNILNHDTYFLNSDSRFHLFLNIYRVLIYESRSIYPYGYIQSCEMCS